MSQSGVAVNPECVTAFNELKLGKELRYIIYRLSDNYTEVIVEDKSKSDDWDEFRQKLLDAKASHKGRTGAGPRFAVYDFKFTLKDGAGDRNKLAFISWSPDEGTLVQPRMIYASSKEGLKKSLNGLQSEIQANREDDLEHADIIKDLSKGTAV